MQRMMVCRFEQSGADAQTRPAFNRPLLKPHALRKSRAQVEFACKEDLSRAAIGLAAQSDARKVRALARRPGKWMCELMPLQTKNQ